MTRRGQTTLLLLGAGAIVAIVAWRQSGRTRPREETWRPPLQLPEPDADAHLRYAFDLFVSAAREMVADSELPTWRLFGEESLARLGPRAADFLLSEERTELFGSRPNVLVNTLHLLPRIEGALSHPRYLPFLRYWFDPRNVPQDGEGNALGVALQREIFPLLARAPDPLEADACVQVLETGPGEADFRDFALMILLESGEGARFMPLYQGLPPNDAEPDGAHRILVLNRIRAMASTGAGEESRRYAEEMEPLLRQALDGPLHVERITAAAALLRLGDDSMAAYLSKEHARLLAEAERIAASDPLASARMILAAWTAAQYLSQEQPDDALKAIALAQMGGARGSPGCVISIGILSRIWPDDPEVSAALWRHIESLPAPDTGLLRRLAPYDRGRVVAEVRRWLESDSGAARHEALSAATTIPLPELVPQILEQLRRGGESEQRFVLYGALVTLHAREVTPLLTREVEHSSEAMARAAAAGSLLDMGTEEGLAAVAAALRRLDEAVLDSVWSRALRGGSEALPAPLVSALIEALPHFPGEAARIKTVLALRARGSMEGVRGPLLEAYQRDPSRLVAKAIREALFDLALRP